MMLSYIKNGYIILLISLLFLGVSIAFAIDKEWNYACGQNVEVEIIGIGIGSDKGDNNPQTLAITHPENIDKIIGQIVCKAPDGVTPPQKAVFSSLAEIRELVVPTIITAGDGYHYEEELLPADDITGDVVGTGDSDYKTPRAFVLYIFRSRGGYYATCGQLVDRGLWWDAVDRPSSHTENIPIPSASVSRDVEVTFVVTDKDSDSGRDVILRAQAGSILQEVKLTQPNMGDELIIHTLVLEDVPGGVTSVAATVISPNDTGDSIFWSGLNVRTPCEGDFGDAPDPHFPTLRIHDGAVHRIIPGIYMGTVVDAEINGQPNPSTTGDDDTGIDDEDGVLFNDSFVQGQVSSVDVSVSSDGYLNAWIDFFGNGDWDDAGEQVATDLHLNTGTTTVNFAVPVTGKSDLTSVARFRFSTTTGLDYTGYAPDGEVEDYLVDVFISVSLTTFSALPDLNGVALEWTTQIEHENLGFFIYRSESFNGDYVQINEHLISGAGDSESKNSYSYVDNTAEKGRTYFYKLADIDFKGQISMHGPVKASLVSIDEYALEQNYPNPFNSETRISFSLKQSGSVILAVYNMQGQIVRTLFRKYMNKGLHSTIWDGRDEHGSPVPAGAYLYTLRINNHEESKKLLFVK